MVLIVGSKGQSSRSHCSKLSRCQYPTLFTLARSGDGQCDIIELLTWIKGEANDNIMNYVRQG